MIDVADPRFLDRLFNNVEDWELFTILGKDDVPALQVLNSQNQWIQAVPIPGTFVINVADSLMRWTNDVFLSTVHRAINISGRERFSIPLFWGADYDRNIVTLESCVLEKRPAKYEEINVQEYIRWRNEREWTTDGGGCLTLRM
jgi:isopenicillin N synthase-like dioxygenase